MLEPDYSDIDCTNTPQRAVLITVLPLVYVGVEVEVSTVKGIE